MMEFSHTLYSPAAERNHSFIVNVVQQYYQVQVVQRRSQSSTMNPIKLLEIASGSGQHAAYLAQALPELHIYPSEISSEKINSINHYQTQLNLQGVVKHHLQKAVMLNVTQPVHQWPLSSVDLMLCINMIHISPWECTQALFNAAADVLPSDGFLILYGPYEFPDQPLAISNQNFDTSLRSRNSSWGIRPVFEIDKYANNMGLMRIETITCPANNHILVYQKRSASTS